MKKIFFTFVFLLLASLPAFADVEVIVAYPYIQDITQKIGKDKVKVTALAKGNWDPHFVFPKPSLIAKARRANLLIINGAQLEIGWLPQIIKQANNPDIQPGTKGLLDLSGYVKMIEVPVGGVSRAQGDIHPQGNPHFVLDPYNIPKISKAITDRLSDLDPSNENYYKANNDTFTKEWMNKVQSWDSKLKNLSGKRVVEYHRLFDYLFERYHMVFVGTLEPLPGVPPTPRHLQEIIEYVKSDDVKFIFQDVYHSHEAGKFVSEKTGVRIVTIPQDVEAISEAKDIFSMFDYIVDELTK